MQLTPSDRDPARIHAARQKLLSHRAALLVENVRDVFCEPTRTQIVRALEVGALSVTDLAHALGHTQTAISQHLRVLRHCGVVSPERRGRVALYTLTKAPVATAAVKAIDVVAQSV